MLLTPAQIKPKIVLNRDRTLFSLSLSLFFFFFFSSSSRRGGVSCSRACLGARFFPQLYQYPNLSEGADRVDGQLLGDKEYPFSGITKSRRVWRKPCRKAMLGVWTVSSVFTGRCARTSYSRLSIFTSTPSFSPSLISLVVIAYKL